MKTTVLSALFAFMFFQQSSAVDPDSVRIIATLENPVRMGDVDLFYNNGHIAMTSIHGASQKKIGFIINDEAFKDCLNFEYNKQYLTVNVQGWPRKVESFECLPL